MLNTTVNIISCIKILVKIFLHDMLKLNEIYVKLKQFPIVVEIGNTKECENNDEKYYEERNGA